ncbi:cytochrome P450 [Rhizophagus irregularis DAOM 181602=DAOM 197198]|uniref:Sterol 14-demethylase n=4 Tax=Rhizophagus irregularis TaxID=588596 RepID=A0A015IGP9_RHIIW|nr:cytochrome P450 [Rhizophagus irregularis DAOM 181602=DAOM 197198]EXX53165.1 sterol 14-demethylase [Rhizophagus irregularis DAOM 197198w]POG72706.1 cytochrome P450 [Rhizophagus irregularis DAOM 181602=DAOM 197198]GBC37397.1 cytochrome P450 [Rhizophagus irregularis DAOM 181602=DAOM 197198]|eukprot:XP_025179572.1 cytochrome P450 [Rhizophagus irregularis DAOM 181602=DAOM 197198]
MIFGLFENFGIYDCVLFLTLTYVAYYYYKYFTRENPLPGPFPFPLVGNFPQILWFIGNIEMFFNCCYKKYGDIYEIYTINIRTIVLCQRKYLDNILSKNTHEMKIPKCKILTKELGSEGKGLTLNNDYKSWMFNRHFFNQAILSPKFTNEAIEQTNKLFNELESYWSKLFLKEEIIKENKNILNFSEWFQYYTNDITIKLLSGKRSYSMATYFNTLSDEKADYPEDAVKLSQTFHKPITEYSIFFVVPPFIRHNIPFFKNKANSILQTLDNVNQTLDAIIKSRRQEIEDTSLNEPLQNDMLTSMIIKNTLRDNNYIETGEAMRSLTDAEIRANMQEAINSAALKIGNMLSFIVYYIAHNPDVKKKLLEEIDSIFQGDKIRPITKDDFYSLSYCEAIVKEVARIFPVTHLITRYIDNPSETAEYHWPAGTLFVINSKVIQNNDDDWEEPNKFNPDRWMVENFEPNKNSFLMFGGGSRFCPGRKLSMIELVCLTALIFRKYEVDLVDMNAPIKVTSDPGLVRCLSLLVEIRPRNCYVGADY